MVDIFDPKKLWELERKKAQTSLEFLACDIIGYVDMRNPWHLREMKRLETNPSEIMFLWSRGHRKTTLISIVDSIRLILNDITPIAIGSHDLGLAQDIVTNVKVILETNEWLKGLFPELLYQDPQRESPLWTKSAIQIKKKDPKIKEPTMSAFSIHSLPTGQHYRVLKLDDMVTFESVTTPEQIQKTKEQFGHIHFIGIGHQTIQQIIGTRYHFDDLYGDIEKEQQYKIVKQPCWGPDNKPIYPWHTIESLLKIKNSKRVSSAMWASQYLLNPIDEEKAIFKREQIRTIRRDLIPSNLAKFTLTDLAISMKDKSDYSTIITVGLDHHNDAYVLNIIREHLQPYAFMNLLFETFHQYRPYKITIEQVAYQEAMLHMLKHEQEIRKDYLPIIPIKRGDLTKNQRIQGMEWRFQSGKIYFAEDCLHFKDAETELLRFNPKSKANKDDIIDALSDIDAVGFIGQGVPPEEDNVLSLDNLYKLNKNNDNLYKLNSQDAPKSGTIIY